ncbi:MAG: 3-hydroxyacyl-CoA dehydrogenase NAD-binding domain-containing protein [Steroidobacteraceae bacterium]|jgi:3-hydroxyacyl-CoA dehydrogenase
MSDQRINAASITSERQGAIVVLTIDNPPVNAISQPVRSALLEAVLAAEQKPDVQAVVIRGTGAHFVAGAESLEFDQEARSPLLNDVLRRIEACTKPIIAAMHGSVLGEGFELALACHTRVAATTASFGMPEIRLGLLPGSGGTQRLPRLIGVLESLKLMLSGDPISCERALALRIVDRVCDESALLPSALQAARESGASGILARRVCDLSVVGGAPTQDSVEEQRTIAARKFPGVESREAIIECVVASLNLPFDAGLALGRLRFEECLRSNSSRALRHLFFAERGMRQASQPRPVSTVGVLGAGTMGSGIAISLATAGYGVLLVDSNGAALAAGMERLRSTLEGSVTKGRLDRSAAAIVLDRVASGDRIEALADVDLVIEAVFENLAVKQQVFAALGRICRPGAVLASNTSTLDIDAIAAASGRPSDVLGMHFFSPANVMRLVEIVRGRATALDVIATVQEVTKRTGKLGIVVGNCFGFVGNRILYAYGRENQLLMLEGATPTQVDAVLERFGMAMGPNAVGDLAGLDVGYRVRRERKDLPDDPRYYRVADLLVESGRLGQKTRAGAFAYSEGARRPSRAPEVEAMIEAEAIRLGVKRREIAADEIRDRCLFALINEGAQILSDGIARSSGDIDAIWCNGYGFPRYRGGPLFYADSIGLSTVLAGIHQFAGIHGKRYWVPSPLLIELVAKGTTFGAWGRLTSSA